MSSISLLEQQTSFYVYRVDLILCTFVSLTFLHCPRLIHISSSYAKKPFYFLPSLKLTTAHLPPQAHFLAPLSPPPPSMALSSSSLPFGKPTTTSALTVRKERMRKPEPGPSGPMASGKGVVGSQKACVYDGQPYSQTVIGGLSLVCQLTSPVSLR